MHPPEARAEAIALVDAGLNDCEISRPLGIPRRTILDWRTPPRKRYVRKVITEVCPRCWRHAKPIRFTTRDYAELLGLYLGDGCISSGPRTMRLRIALDLKYPQIIQAVRALLARCFPENRVDVIRKGIKGRCVNVSVYSRHLPCLLPQHGSGKKHQRGIALESWQEAIVEAEPWAFIRACVWTDGCAFINRTDIHRPQPYEYLSYQFSNMSRDIVDLFVRACDRVEVATRVNCDPRGLFHVRINRRNSVELMVRKVGLKSLAEPLD
jgi:Homeodomain-like domain